MSRDNTLVLLRALSHSRSLETLEILELVPAQSDHVFQDTTLDATLRDLMVELKGQGCLEYLGHSPMLCSLLATLLHNNADFRLLPTAQAPELSKDAFFQSHVVHVANDAQWNYTHKNL